MPNAVQLPAPPSPVLLAAGDRMDRPTFHRLYLQTPEKFKAELFSGRVHVHPPRITYSHGRTTAVMAYWLGIYQMETPNMECGLNATFFASDDCEPQPDVFLAFRRGGNSKSTPDGFLTGVPELPVEVAERTVELDLLVKPPEYYRQGASEYLVVVVPTKTVHWFVRGHSGVKELTPDAAGVLKSKAFPGLWLLPDAVFDRTAKRLLATLRLGLASPAHAKFAAKLQAKLAKKAK